ncbi:PepSY domain-containing protein [Lysobacter enzymogenes]|uniref:PepSY domain-containing protein n=1 Tax=Lysobacter enzymogenes TaxID=69 RepID=UPI00099D411F|nr:PepSY domain-containing protein [Lysobacter enzymogenes]UZW61208.1 PepSY domain-containing protein [Lysobacter enzymogenes]
MRSKPIPPRPVPPRLGGRILLALALAVAGAGLSAGAQVRENQTALTEHDVRSRLAERGYTRVNDLDFSGGVWRADARSADGNRVQVALDPTDGRIYPDEQVAQLSRRDIQASLSAAGYTDIHDLDYRDGLWLAKAEDPGGRDVELRLDPDNGRIAGVDKD